jgi:hypothetical protein
MDDNKFLRIVYTFFLGILLAIFVGVGVNTFYEGPKAPEYPIELNTYGKEPTPEQVSKQQKFDKQNQQYTEKLKPYNRNVSIITLAASIILLAISLIYEKKIKIIADGVMLGGVFTLLYSLGRSFASEDTKYTFAVVTVGLAVALYLGYHRFIRPHQAPKKSSSSK